MPRSIGPAKLPQRTGLVPSNTQAMRRVRWPKGEVVPAGALGFATEQPSERHRRTVPDQSLQMLRKPA